MKLGQLIDRMFLLEDEEGTKTKIKRSKKKANPDQLQAANMVDKNIKWSPPEEEPHHAEWLQVYDVSYILVDGPFVRDNVHVDFVEGGHYYRYAFIPENEIWIEDDMTRLDQVTTAVHETRERYLMKEFGWGYDKAHDAATEIETKLRQLLMKEGTFIPTDAKVVELLSRIMQGGEDITGGVITTGDRKISVGDENNSKEPKKFTHKHNGR
jgi:hypothetical protein